jgi:hypothetical protein
MRIAAVAAVFVPFEIGFDGLAKKRDDLPMFLEAQEVVRYLQTHPRLARWRLEWRMHSERDLVEEYAKKWRVNL